MSFIVMFDSEISFTRLVIHTHNVKLILGMFGCGLFGTVLELLNMIEYDMAVFGIQKE